MPPDERLYAARLYSRASAPSPTVPHPSDPGFGLADTCPQPVRSIWDGTTPEGREMLRKLLFQADRMVKEGTPASDIVAQLKRRLDTLPELHHELGLIFSRLYGVQCPAGELTVNDLAVLVVVCAGLDHQQPENWG